HPTGAVRPAVAGDPVGGPGQGEAVVEDAARVERAAEHVVEDRQRGDGGQVGRLGLSDVELADAGVGDAHHADVAGPRLGGDRLDDVVAVEALEVLEEVEGAARAAAAPDVDPDVGVAEGV